jgi:hypothetical protein
MSISGRNYFKPATVVLNKSELYLLPQRNLRRTPVGRLPPLRRPLTNNLPLGWVIFTPAHDRLYTYVATVAGYQVATRHQNP